VLIGETFSSLKQLLILVAFWLDQWCETEERARIVARDFQHVAERRHQHVAGGG
jgi:hypothetical protein